VTAIDQESADVVSLTMQRLHDEPLPEALPSQYFVLRFRPSVGDPPLFRSHSLSGPASTDRYRISVKIEPNGVGGAYVETTSGWGIFSKSARRAGRSSCSPARGPWRSSAPESG
jgi:ferredoxin-NADP reductase